MEKHNALSYLCLLIFFCVPTLTEAQCPTCSSDAGTSGCTITISTTVSNPSYSLSSSSDKLCITSSGRFEGTWGITISDPSAMIVNNGTIDISGGISVADGIFINNNELRLTGDLVINDGQLVNRSLTVVGGDLSVAGSTAEFCNEDSVNVNTDVLLSGDFSNNGEMIVGNEFNQSSGDICVSGIGKVYAYDFETNGDIRGPTPGNGCAYFEVDNSSTVNSTGTLTGQVDFCDNTPPFSTPFIDSHSGTIGPNVSYCSCLSILPLPFDILQFDMKAISGGLALDAKLSLSPTSRRLWLSSSPNGVDFNNIHMEDFLQTPSFIQFQLELGNDILRDQKWFRLGVEDIDGFMHHSSLIEILLIKDTTPFDWTFLDTKREIALKVFSRQELRFRLFNLKGKEVWQFTNAFESGEHSLKLPLHLPKGVYYFSAQSPSFNKGGKLLLR